VLTEGNKVVDFFTNIIFFFAGIKDKVFESFQEVLREGKARLILDAHQVSKVQNKLFVLYGNKGVKTHVVTKKVR